LLDGHAGERLQRLAERIGLLIERAARGAAAPTSLRGANGSRERAPDDRLRDEAIHASASGEMDGFSALAMTRSHQFVGIT
jgi:hypothetical protein